MDEAFENCASGIMPIFFEIVFRKYRKLKEIQLLEKELIECNVNNKTLPDYIKIIIDRLGLLNINSNIKKLIFQNIEKWLLEQDEIRKTYNKTNYDIKYWPNPTLENRSIYNTHPIREKKLLIDNKTKIGSIGSCFATEIKRWLVNNNFNYVETEKNKHSCADWGPKFNSSSIRLLLEYYLMDKELPDFLMRIMKNDTIKYQDPFREEKFFDSVADYIKDKDTHRLMGKNALKNLDVLIITLGLTETWQLSSNSEIVFSRSPWNCSPSLCKRKVLTVQDNLKELNYINKIIKLFNPNIHLILSVSPVPLLATFQTDNYHVAEATMLSKSTLRLAIDYFVMENSNATYFPSFEMVSYCVKDPWDSDQRHINKEAVQKVMNMFNKYFVKNDFNNHR